MEDIIKKMSIRGRMYFCLQCLLNAFKKNNVKTVESELIIKIIIDFLRKDEFNKWDPCMGAIFHKGKVFIQ